MTINNSVVQFPISIQNGGFGQNNANDSKQYATTFGLNSGKNFLIGGNFETNPWTRGFDQFVQPANGSWIADMWSYHYQGAAQVTIQPDQDSPSVSQSGILADTDLLVEPTTYESPIGAGSYYFLRTRVESPNPAYFYGSTMTLSFWVNCFIPGTYCIRFTQSPGGQTSYIYITEYTITNRGQWQFVTVTLPTPNYNNHLYIDFVMGCGVVNQTATINTWFASNAIASVNQTNGMGGLNLFKLQFVQLEAGSAFTGYEIRSPEEEYLLAQRYCESSYYYRVTPGTPTSVNCVFATGAIAISHGFQLGNSKLIPFRVQKPDSFNGVIDLYDVNGQYAHWQWIDANGNITEPTLQYTGPITGSSSNGFQIQTSSTVPNPLIGCWGHYVARWEF